MGPGAGLFILVVGGIAMSAPVPGGMGTYEWLVIPGLLLYGVENGKPYALLVHLSQILLIILLGGISFLLLFLVNRKNQK